MEKIMISAYVPIELNEKRKKLGMTWGGLIKVAFDNMELAKASQSLIDEYKKMKDKQIHTAQLLQKYVNETNEVE